MKAEFIEKYIALEEMQPGDVAVSKDRKSVYVCGRFAATFLDGEKGYPAVYNVVLDLNNLYDQYIDQRDVKKQVKLLKSGDRILLEK